MKPRLVYFDFPVRAEVSRLLFTLAKVDFDVSAVRQPCCGPHHDTPAAVSTPASLLQDTRISYDQNWAQGEWKDKCTFGQVPILEVDGGKVLAQSAAIGEQQPVGCSQLAGRRQPCPTVCAGAASFASHTVRPAQTGMWRA